MSKNTIRITTTDLLDWLVSAGWEIDELELGW